MAQIIEKVYLGYEDEEILDKHSQDVTFCTNKIGGQPNWPPGAEVSFSPECAVCGLLRPLVLQCYAPLQGSPYNRTLYIFACVNPTCWNNANSWTCVRCQHVNKSYEEELKQSAVTVVSSSTSAAAPAARDPWCSGADDWGDDDGTNGSNIFVSQMSSDIFATNNNLSLSDDDGSSIQMDSIEMAVECMNISGTTSLIKDPSLLCGKASAEIENDENITVSVDTPITPINDISALLKQVPDVPVEFKNSKTSPRFHEKFIIVEEEYISSDESDHVKKLLQQYEKHDKKVLKSIEKTSKNKIDGDGNDHAVEDYEKAVPLHGDEIFHNFLTRIQYNPSQVLRYSLGGQPLIMTQLPSTVRSKRCLNCNGCLQFELQILPTIIPSLRLPNSVCTHLEFGNILVYTCKNSCWSDKNTFVCESIISQSEPLA